MELLDNALAKKKTLKAQNIIAGKESFKDDGLIQSVNPSNLDDIVAIAPRSNQDDVDAALNAAASMKKPWRDTPSPIRAQIIGKLGELVSLHKNDLAAFMTREMGKTVKESEGEVQEVIDTCHFFQSEGRRLYGQTVPSEMRNKELFTYRRPYGVVAMITPSNFPIAVASWKAIPAILCGNTIVWKTPPEAPGIAYLFAKLWQQAGLPNGVLNLIHGDGQTGQWLVDEVDKGRIDKVTFTGSTQVGKKIGEICGRNLQIPSLELGGKNPLIVMDDANLDLAIEGALWGSFGTSGQRCTSTGNIILHESIADRFIDTFLKRAKAIHIGNPNIEKDALYGPMIDQHYLNHFLNHFELAKESGSTLLYGHGRITPENKPANFKPDPDKGFYAWPTIWTDVHIDHWVAQNEVFGPCVSLIPVKDIDEAIEVANGTPYGLSSAIYTNSRMNAYLFKENIQAGMSGINNSTTGAEAHLPFGGVKNSGNGTRESGIWVVDAFTQWQAVNDELSGKLQLAQMDTEFIQPLSSTFELSALI